MRFGSIRRSECGVRIVYILNSLGIGGAERQALDIAERMAGRGHEVSVLTLRSRLPEEWPTTLPVHHIQIRRTPFSVAAGLIRARRMLRVFQPDLVHSHSFHANILARLLKPLIPRVTVISTIHNVYEGRSYRMLAYRLTDPLARRTTAVSQAAAERFIRLKAIPARKCIAVPNAIDVSAFTPDPDRRLLTRTAIGATTNSEFIWLAAGRLIPAKDYPNLLDAFAQVIKTVPHAQLWIAGQSSDGHSEQGRGENGILALPKAQPNQIRFLGLRRDMSALFDAADGFVLSSAWEGMPLVLAEAMAMEKPVVSTDVGGVRELLGETGRIIPPKDPNALAGAMLSVMAQPHEDRRTQGRAARRRIAQSFDIESRVCEWEALYCELLGSHA